MHLSASWVIQFHDSPCVFKDIRFELGQAEGQAKVQPQVHLQVQLEFQAYDDGWRV